MHVGKTELAAAGTVVLGCMFLAGYCFRAVMTSKLPEERVRETIREGVADRDPIAPHEVTDAVSVLANDNRELTSILLGMLTAYDAVISQLPEDASKVVQKTFEKVLTKARSSRALAYSQRARDRSTS